MQSITARFLFLRIICLHNVSGQDTPTADEKAIGLAIANKLNGLMKPKLSRASIKSMSGGLGVKNSIQSGKQYLDFQLLVDSSGSIRSSNFDVAKDATNIVVDFINSQSALSPSGSRAALIKFSSPRLTKLVFGFGDHKYAYDVKKKIKNLRYENGPSTATALALAKAKTEFQQNPSSRNVKVVWIFTDGISSTGGSPISAANQLKGMGVTICSMAVGSRVNMAEINGMSSLGCVYKAKTFRSNKRIMQYGFKSRGAGAAAPVLDPGFFKGIKF